MNLPLGLGSSSQTTQRSGDIYIDYDIANTTPQPCATKPADEEYYNERLKKGACRECDKLFTKGLNGWRRRSLADLEKFTPIGHGSLQAHYGTVQRFLCINCIYQKFENGTLLARDYSPTVPPLCLECGHLFLTNYDTRNGIYLATINKKKKVSLRERYGTLKGILCRFCVCALFPRCLKESASQQSTQPSVIDAKRNHSPKQNGLGKKIQSITMTSGKKVYGSTKKAVLIQEIKKFKYRYGQCWPCKCKTGANAREKVGRNKLQSYVSKDVDESPQEEEIVEEKEKKEEKDIYVRDKVTLAYSKRNYRMCTRYLTRQQVSWKYMKRAVSTVLKKECNAYKRQRKKLALGQFVNEKSLTTFSWAAVLQDARTYMPTLMEFLSVLFPSGNELNARKKRRGQTTNFEGECDMISESRLGFIVALLSYSIHSRLSLVQSLLTLEAWKFGVTPEMVERLTKLGIFKYRAITVVNKMHWKEMQLVKCWKTDALRVPTEDALKPPEIKAPETKAPRKKPVPKKPIPPKNHGLRATPVRLARKPEITEPEALPEPVVQYQPIDAFQPVDASQPVDVLQLEAALEPVVQPEPVFPPGPPVLPPEIKEGLGFSLFWKEVKVELGGTRYTHGKPAKGVVLFAVQNRVNFSLLPDASPSIQARDIPLEALMPERKDYAEQRRRMEHVVCRILAKHLGLTDKSHAQGTLTRSIQHRYSKHMKKKSDIVHLGLMKEDPSTCKGYKAILQELSKYVPVNEQGQPMPTPLCADAPTLKSILTMNLDGNEVNSQVQGLLPVVHEFTRIRGLLREFFDLLYHHQSRGDKGTVYELIEAFGYYCSFDGEDKRRCAFLQLMTEAHVIMLAKKLADGDGWDLDDEADRSADRYRKLAAILVDFLWCEEHVDQVNEILTADKDGRQPQNLGERLHTEDEIPMEVDENECHCGQNLNEDMVRCDFLHCPAGNFHLRCVGMKPSTVPTGEWWCSDECEASMSDDTFAYCFCHKYEKDMPMIQCELARRCTENQWYHLACLEMTEENVPKIWFCSDACKARRRAPTQDYMQNYAKELTWQGLKYMTRMDAMHEGDGEAMLSYWKLDLLYFWNRNNWTYTIIAHNFLTGVCGLYSPRLSHELIWNRVANITGMPGDNVGLDQVDELVNRDFRDTAKHHAGVLTEKQADQHNVIGGRLSCLHHLFYCKEQCDLLGRRQTAKNYKEVSELVSKYEDRKFFDHVPGRHHQMFPDFKVNDTLRDPQLLAGDLKRLAELLDRPSESNT